MLCQGHKGGTGTSSRLVPQVNGKDYVVGVVVQSNFGQRLTLQIGGVPIGKLLARDELARQNPNNEATAPAGQPVLPDERISEGSKIARQRPRPDRQ